MKTTVLLIPTAHKPTLQLIKNLEIGITLKMMVLDKECHGIELNKVAVC